jgi:Glycosyl transferase family 2
VPATSPIAASSDMPAAPRVSVICAVYNGEAFLPETLSRLQSQDEANFEAIFIDDASSDRSASLLASVTDRRFITQTNASNQGRIVSRNRAIDLARSDYIAVTDQDDPSYRSRLRMQANYLDRHPSASATFTLIRSIDEHSKRVGGVSDWAYSGEQARAALIFHNFISHSTLMFRRSRIAGPVYPPDHPHCEDYRLLSQLADSGSGVHAVKRHLVGYRYHNSNHTLATHAEMANASRQLRASLLSRLGLRPTDAEMTLHDQFEGDNGDLSIERYKALKDWVLHLCEANRRAGYIEPAAFSAVAAAEWLELSQRFSALGRQLWSEYLKGPQPGFNQLPHRARLWAKTRAARARSVKAP